MKTNNVTRDQWIAQIAEKSGRDASEVESLFSRNGIAPRLAKPIPHRLRLEALSFTGQKTGEFETKDIAFSKDDLAPGVYAIVSVDNFKGKTTLFRIIRWLLTGTYDLPSDMKGWLHSATLRFFIDDKAYEVTVEDVAEMRGTLTSTVRGKQLVIGEFGDSNTFATVMDDFFLRSLVLEPLVAVADRGDAVEQRHGWNWLYSAMVIDPAPDVLFGTDTNHGKPLRMMQMYLGIPWVLTRADMMAAKKREEIEATQSNKVNQDFVASTERRLSELRKSKGEYQAKVAAQKSVADLKGRSLVALNAYMNAASKVQKLTPLLATAVSELAASEDAVGEAVRELTRFRETQAAGKVFRKLRPVSCPSCEESYTDEYRELKENNHDCVVCGRHEVTAGDPAVGAEESLVQAVEDAKAEKTKRRKHHVNVKQKMDAAVDERDDQDKLYRKLEKEIDAAKGDSGADIEVIRIDAQITELERMTEERKGTGSGDTNVWDTAIELTKQLYDDEQNEVLRTVSSLITQFAQSFGMTDLVSIKLKGNTNMDVVMKGGPKTFKGCEPGERMRLKTAATLALIRVSEDRGIGTHPGVLFVDSVANNEITDKDVTEIMTGLATLRDSLPDIQIFVAGIESEAILTNVPCDNVIKNRDDGYLW